MFPDSKIAKDFSCGRSKASALIKCCATEISDGIADRMRENPFSIGTDGSHDGGSGQLYPVVVRTFDDSAGEVTTDLLSIKECDGASTGENIFNVLNEELKSKSIPWSNCIGFSCDNASVMTGAHAGVAAFIQKENQGIYINGCPSHLLHLAAKAGAKELHMDIEQVLIDIFFYLDKSSKRKKELKKIQEECGVKLHSILKYGATRWLSLQDCVVRLLEQWEPLNIFFDAELASMKPSQAKSSKSARLHRVTQFFANSSSKLYCFFLKENLPLFTNANLVFQKGAPQIHRMMSILDELVTDLLIRFVKPDVIAASSCILKIEFSAHKNQKPRKDLVMGHETQSCLKELKEKGLVKDAEDIFIDDVRRFFSGALKYIISKFPILDDFLENAAVLDMKKRLSVKFSMLQYFTNRFPCLTTGGNMTALQLEFARYQVDQSISDVISQEERVDRQWYRVGEMKTADGAAKYPHLSVAMKGLCCLTHSNADVERIFSLVRKNQTEFRPSLSTDTVSALVVQKVHMIARGSVCHQQTFSPALISKAKSAYYQSMKK